MVRFIAENNIEDPMDIQKFDRLGYSFRVDLSSDNEYVFERNLAKLFRQKMLYVGIFCLIIGIITIFLDID